jgi:hypothetical protein
LAKHSGAYKSEKRKKELLRQKKQEVKRQRRLEKNVATGEKDEPALSEEKESHEENKEAPGS